MKLNGTMINSAVHRANFLPTLKAFGDRLTSLRIRGRRLDMGVVGLDTVNYLTLTFLLLPIAVVVIASFTSGHYVSFPPKWPLSMQWYEAFIKSDLYIEGIKNSMITGGLVIVVAGTVGTLASVGWTLRKFKGQELVYYLLFLPFLIPGLVIGIGILMSLDPLRLDFLVGNRWAVIVGHCLWATPLVFIVMVSVLLGIDPALVPAAKNLGAKPWRAFWEVTVPLVKAGILASLILAFIISFHEFIIALFLTAATSRTLPVLVWNSLRFEVSPIIAAIDGLMIVSIIIALAAISKLVGIEKIKMR